MCKTKNIWCVKTVLHARIHIIKFKKAILKGCLWLCCCKWAFKRVSIPDYLPLNKGQGLRTLAAHIYPKLRGVPPPPPRGVDTRTCRTFLVGYCFIHCIVSRSSYLPLNPVGGFSIFLLILRPSYRVIKTYLYIKKTLLKCLLPKLNTQLKRAKLLKQFILSCF